MSEELVKWALTQGGLVVVVLVLMWSYRRDLTRIQIRDQERTEVLIGLVRDVTGALQELRDLIKSTKTAR